MESKECIEVMWRKLGEEFLSWKLAQGQIISHSTLSTSLSIRNFKKVNALRLVRWFNCVCVTAITLEKYIWILLQYHSKKGLSPKSGRLLILSF